MNDTETAPAAPLWGKHVAIPESRLLDVLANMLEKLGATTTRCPLISIHDSPEQVAVTGWLRRFIEQPPAWFVVLTGEGVRRLVAAAERAGIEQDFIAALKQTNTLVRGPKPGQALKPYGIKPTHLSSAPTSDGIIATLQQLHQNQSLSQQRVAVQLYGDYANPPLINALTEVGAIIDVVAPYRYASDDETEKVSELISLCLSQQLDAVTFTSSSQVIRLFKVAKKQVADEALRDSLNSICVAAVGPVVLETLAKYGVDATVSPATHFSMKPLAKALSAHFSG